MALSRAQPHRSFPELPGNTTYSKHALKVPMTPPMDSTSLPLRSQIYGLLEALACSLQGLLHSSAIKFPCVSNSCVNFIRAILIIPSLH